MPRNMGTSGEITKPAAFLPSEGELQFPKSHPRRRKSLIASFPSTTFGEWPRCQWAVCPWSSAGADCVSPISLGSCWAPLLPLKPRGRNNPEGANLSRFLWPWIHPEGCGRDQVRAMQHPCSCFPSNSSSCFPLQIPFLSLQSRPTTPSLSHTKQRLGEFHGPYSHLIHILMEDAFTFNLSSQMHSSSPANAGGTHLENRYLGIPHKTS